MNGTIHSPRFEEFNDPECIAARHVEIPRHDVRLPLSDEEQGFILALRGDNGCIGESIAKRFQQEPAMVRPVMDNEKPRLSLVIKFEFHVHSRPTEKCMKIGSDGVQIVGGHGFTKEHPVERWYRDLRAVALMHSGLHA